MKEDKKPLVKWSKEFKKKVRESMIKRGYWHNHSSKGYQKDCIKCKCDNREDV